MARNAKRSEGLHNGGKAGEKGGKRRGGLLSPRPSGRARAVALPKHPKLRPYLAALAGTTSPWEAPVASRLSPEGIPVPYALGARIAQISSGYVVSATFLGPDYQRHEVQASSATFAGVLAELSAAVASTLGAA
jgi:hypothetical protein